MYSWRAKSERTFEGKPVPIIKQTGSESQIQIFNVSSNNDDEV